MKLFAVILVFTLFFSISDSCFSQKQVEISGVKYILHTVSKSETVYNLCQKYKISQNDILKANPGLSTMLKTGSTVRIPVNASALEQKNEAPVAQKSQSDEEIYYHKVGKKQTIMSIAKQYEITANELIRYNPELTKGLLIGQVLRIPVSITKSSLPASSESVSTKTELANIAEYSIHKVVSGETIYGLEQRYGVPHEEILKANPALQGGLRIGMKLKIPAMPLVEKVVPEIVEKIVPVAVEKAVPVVDTKSNTKYTVEKGETLFSISNRFGVEISDLKKTNPSLLSRSLESGETILIPQQETKKSETNNSQPGVILVQETPKISSVPDCHPLSSNVHQKYKVGLLLPFYIPEFNGLGNAESLKSRLLNPINFNTKLNSSNTDTSFVINGTNVDSRAIGFLEFYEGAVIAIDSLRRCGMNVELFAFDASTQEKVTELLQLQEFFELNLIIGPVHPEIQQSVAAFAAKNRIPMVSPLSAAGDFEQNNAWYFKVNPDKEYQMKRTADYVARTFSAKNFFLLQLNGNSSSSDVKLTGLCKERLNQDGKNSFFHEYSFQREGVNNIKPLLDETGENIFIIPTENEAQVSVAITNLTALAEHYNIVLMGTSALTKLKSIQTENYHRVRLRFLSPYFIDYNKPLVRRFVGQYRDLFYAEPSQFSFQGFDVSFYFLNALFRYGKDFRNCIADYPMELTQMNFHFGKVSPMGGSVNKSLFVTSYERNYDVINLGSVSDSGK
jgi:LysM repeat protein/ABC-type branched-subunit amino acid transport system substrate-binding protein